MFLCVRHRYNTPFQGKHRGSALEAVSNIARLGAVIRRQTIYSKLGTQTQSLLKGLESLLAHVQDEHGDRSGSTAALLSKLHSMRAAANSIANAAGAVAGPDPVQVIFFCCCVCKTHTQA